MSGWLQALGEAALSGRPQLVHASQGLRMGLYTPTILGGKSYLSWFYDSGAIKAPPSIGTSKGDSQAIDSWPVRTFLPNYANVYITIQSHALSAGAQSLCATAPEVRDGLVCGAGSW